MARSFDEIAAAFEDSESLFGAKRRVLSELAEVVAEAAVEDWDGYGAAPVLPGAVERAKAFIRRLPQGCPLPAPSAEPDGEVALEWIAARDRILSVSFGEEDRVAYAMVDGTNRSKGVQRIESDEIPELLRLMIEQIVG